MNDTRHVLKFYLDALNASDLVESSSLVSSGEKEVTGLTFDSREVEPGTLFICKGAHFEQQFLDQALDSGAICYISEKPYRTDVPYIITKDIRKAMPILANLYYNEVWKKIRMIGITGTKGKSTTAYFLRSILNERKDAKECALISSIDTYDGAERFESHLTTPEAVTLHKHIDNAVKSGIKDLVMEVSSQALKYDRTEYIDYDIGCFLNLGEDHISPLEHSDFEDYASSKMKLFEQSKICVINADSKYSGRAISAAKSSATTERIFTFGETGEVDLLGYDVKAGMKGITFMAKCADFDERFEIGLPGSFNVSNALAAIAMAHMAGVSLEDIKNGLRSARADGRMEVYTDPDERMTVIVDYAHNKMSFNSLFEAVKRDNPDKKIFIVFGCPGKKALDRREDLGLIAGKYADMTYLTEEDAGEEDVHKISEEIASFVEKAGGKYKIIDDRGEAIRAAINEADEDTIILLTGKGRETRMKRGIEYIDTPSDVDYAVEALNERF